MKFATQFKTYPQKGRQIKQWNLAPKQAIITSGWLPNAAIASVYVGKNRSGRIKIGMTTDEVARGSALRVEIIYFRKVRALSAKDVETETLRMLGHYQGDGEWADCAPEVAIEAVDAAVDLVRRRMWVDIDLSERQARELRIKLALGDIPPEVVAATPEKTNRISIAAARRCFGIRGAYGGRF